MLTAATTLVFCKFCMNTALSYKSNLQKINNLTLSKKTLRKLLEGILKSGLVRFCKMILKFLLLIHFLSKCSSDHENNWSKNLARPAPFCVDDQVAEVNKFFNIIQHHNILAKTPPRYLIHVATTADVPDHDHIEWAYSNSEIFPKDKRIPRHPANYQHRYKDFSVTFSRINPQQIRATQPLFNLKQWIHLSFVSKVPLKGIYVQSISAPMGVPFGQFSKEFNCGDCYLTKGYKLPYKVTEANIELVPCRYRAVHSLMHPNVAVVGGDRNVPAFDTFHVHFHWSEGDCQEAPLMQFLIIAVTNFDDVEKGHVAFYTQVMNNTVPDSADMTAYPFHPELNKDIGRIQCHGHQYQFWPYEDLINYEMLKIRPYQRQHVKLIYNKQYDDCVVHKGAGGPSRFECPPGPFKCETTKQSLTFNQLVAFRIKFYSDPTKSDVCHECNDERDHIHPGPEQDVSYLEDPEYIKYLNYTSKSVLGLVNDLNKDNLTTDDVSNLELEQWFFHEDVKRMVNMVHATLMIFGFVTCPLISHFVARFFKETGHLTSGLAFSNSGVWLWAHITMSYMSLASMWGAMSVIMFYDSSCERCSIPHAVAGILAMTLFHVNHMSGWCRPVGTKMRKFVIWWHVLFGYGSQISAVVAYLLIMETARMNMTYAVILALIGAAVLYIPATILQKYIDKRVFMEVERTIIPVPESIHIPDETPCGSCRTFILLILVVVEIICFIWVMVVQGQDF